MRLSIKQDMDVTCMVNEGKPAITCIIRLYVWLMGPAYIPVESLITIIISTVDIIA